MRDGLVFRSIPLFTGSLAFVPACNGGGDNVADGDSGDTEALTESSSGNDSVDGSSDDTLDTGSSDTSPTDTGDESSTDSGDPQCGTGTCGALAPVGWFGPAIYKRLPVGAPVEPCPTEVDDAGPTLVEGFADPGPAICSCECELSAPQTCNGSMSTSVDPDCNDEQCYYYYMGMCYGYGYGYGTAVTADCMNVEIEGFVRFNSNEGYGYGGQSFCEESETEMIPPFNWQSAIATCRVPETALLCDDGVCLPPVPDGFEATWCIYQQGDLECPAGEFSNKLSFFTDVEDTRDCTNCTCGTAGTSCEDATMMVFDQPDCAGIPSLIVESDNICIAGTGQSVAGDFGGDNPCPVTEAPTPEGAIAPTGAFTFCCAS
jgi:hypothetical protein